MAKTIVFYGRDGTAAKARAREISATRGDRGQAIQADAWRGERLEADQFEVMGDVPAPLAASIRQIFDEVLKLPEGTSPTTLMRPGGSTEPRASNLTPGTPGGLPGDDDNGRDELDTGKNPLNRQPKDDALPSDDELHGMTNSALREYATERGIDVGHARLKEELIAAIKEGKKPERAQE